MKQLNEILNILPKLTQQELKKVEDTLKFYLEPVEAEKSLTEIVLLFDSVHDKVKELTGNTYFFEVFKKSKIGYKQLQKCLKTLDIFINLLKQKIVIERAFKKQVYNVYADIITEYLLKYRIPISIISVFNCHEKFLPLIDKKYPGYLENGLLYLIFCDNVEDEVKKIK